MRCMVECTQGLATLLLAHDPPFIISLPYDTPPPLVASNLPIKTLVARKWPTKYNMQCHALAKCGTY